ncbi:MAG: 4-hydroxy-3-methylbut-2-enyl diphosphate reductase [Candidatus Fibromonas sp.]|jgi:4-hydroxy-3-methylbut-2-enyl diphosphate reductase|nr:4-hydroxy-3-methylbut-2-enyl diphosphate reductase [Candidatus Fibromonas sp.]
MKCILATPRGFCAGVERAILMVEKSIEKFGKPVYVRHEIVHNRFVVDNLRKTGAIFVENLSEVPAGAVVIFSAHGVSNDIYESAKKLHLKVIDATCPIVKSVHKSAIRYARSGCFIVLIGHRGHAEIDGTLGQLPQGRMHLISSVADAKKLPPVEKDIAYLTQTTLSIEETADIISALKERYPDIQGSKTGNVCYATTNRQSAVRSICEEVDILLIVGSRSSSNSNRLRELGEEQGIRSILIDSVEDLNRDMFANINSVGISSGASAPDYLVSEIINWLRENFAIDSITEKQTVKETTKFPLPQELCE